MKSKKYATGGEIATGAMSGMSMGASLGSIFPGPGTLIGAGVGLVGGAILAATKKEPVEQYQAQAASNSHIFAMGGNIQDMASEVEAGGTHEQNPNGGVPVTPNALLEEGEIKVGNKVFSKRLINPTTGKSFADEAKSYIDPKRPNDFIVNNYAKKKLTELFELQESMKAPQQPAQGQPQQMALGGGIPPLDQFGDFENSVAEYYNLFQPETPMGNISYKSPLTNNPIKSSTVPTGLGNLPTLDAGLGTNFAGDLQESQDYMKSLPGESLPDLYNTPLKYAALASNIGQLGVGLLSKERTMGLDEFTNKQFLTYNPVSYDQAFRNLQSSYGGYKNAAASASGGSAGRLLNSLQGLNLGQSKSIADLAFNADRENEARRMAVQQGNSQINAQNQAMRFQTEAANQGNSAAYTDHILGGIGAIGNTLGNMRTENVRLGIADRMADYNANGEYKMVAKFNQLKGTNPNYTWEQYIADVQSGKITIQ